MNRNGAAGFRSSRRPGLNVLGVIPARRGSKGVPRKNVRQVGGRPLVAWTWLAALAAPSLSRLLVSTDDPAVVRLARAAGVEVPFMRPTRLASDTASAVDVMLHALEWLDHHEGYRPDAVMWLQPTSPLRTATDIEAALALFRAKRAASVVSVCEAEQHPAWMKRITPRGQLTPWDGRLRFADRRQELPPLFRLNGALYVTRTRDLLRRQTFYPPATYAYVMPRERSLDIDTEWDLRVADLVLTRRSRRAAN